MRAFLHLVSRKKIDCFNMDGYCDHCKTVFEAMGRYCHFCSCQEAQILNEEIRRERERDDMRREYIKKKGYKVKEMWECE